MRNYQRKKKNNYILPHNVYMQALYAIKDYDRLRKEKERILNASPPPPDGRPTGKGGVGSLVENKALKLAEIDAKISAISTALSAIPKEYHDGVMNNIIYGSWFPIDAGIRTYQYHKQRFIYHVAVELNLF